MRAVIGQMQINIDTDPSSFYESKSDLIAARISPGWFDFLGYLFGQHYCHKDGHYYRRREDCRFEEKRGDSREPAVAVEWKMTGTHG